MALEIKIWDPFGIADLGKSILTPAGQDAVRFEAQKGTGKATEVSKKFSKKKSNVNSAKGEGIKDTEPEERPTFEQWYPAPTGTIPRFTDIYSSSWIKFEGFAIGNMTDNTWNFDGKDKSKQKSLVKGSQMVNYRLHFLMPREIMETLQHTYAAYDTFGGKIAEKYAQLGGIVWKQLQGIAKPFGGVTTKGFIDEVIKILKSGGVGQALVDKAAEIANKLVGQSDVHFYKYDAPIVYKGSERRTYEFVFYLTAINNRYDDVVFPVKLLQYLSSPTKDNVAGDTKNTMANTMIKPPFFFSIESEPNDHFLSIPRAVIRAVNPVFKGPWVNGYPTYCELRLSITEIDPLFDDVFNRDDVVTAAIKDRSVPLNNPIQKQGLISSSIDQSKLGWERTNTGGGSDL